MQADNPIRVQTLTGAAIAPHAAAFRRVQREVFGDWPYLIGPAATPSSGVGYLRKYVTHSRAALFLVSDATGPVGAATCLPMEDESPHIQAPFVERGWDLRQFFYYGEGVIREPYRGRGLGVRLFQLRESHARAVSTADYAVFCSVRRPADHPLRPAVPHTNDAFWRKRGFVPMPGVACTMVWRDRDQAEETPHPLDFWIKSLSGAALP